jgi:hypothetical protein
VLWAGGSDVDGVGPVHDDVRAAVGQRHVLEPDIEVAVGVPVCAGCGIEGAREHSREAVMPLGGARAYDHHPVYEFYADALLLRPRLVFFRRDLGVHPLRGAAISRSLPTRHPLSGTQFYDDTH